MRKAFEINVFGTFMASKLASFHMAKQEFCEESKIKGVIVNIASVAGYEGQRGQTVYAGTKGAIIAMALPMARDLGSFGIRVVTIAPGIFETPMAHGVSQKVADNLLNQTALGRFGKPEELADFVAGCIRNDYLTGSVSRLDGGIRLPKM